MIEAEQWKQLLNHCLRIFSKKHHLPAEIARPVVEQSHALFRQLRKKEV
jgi:hypothetical protein